ncbi:protein ZINC INDUCED FACILITATOR-LIKE 1-like [Miscanthus floridulus]|uniref:protein ZINC INDUCED FACILITATOR-LIKE 1-like n=1 Tax=Miscanthus floridulus TaxID=154761 RepID=UPI00345876D3
MAGCSEGEAAVPLLEEQEQPTAVYFDGCPGCIIDREKAESTGIPYWRFFHIWIINLVVCLPISSIFPFIYFMIRDLHVAKRVEDIGFYAGFVGASLMLGRALTSTFWGMVADRIGRKPVIVFGIFTTLVFNTLFGLSVHYWMALATRFLLGSLNGLLGTLRAYAVEVSRPEHHAIGLSLISTSWAIGLILGPSIGGYLAQPTEKYPKLFPANSLFGRFPYFLPCLCITVFCLGILLSCVCLQETLHTHKLEKEQDQATKTINGYLAGAEENVEQHITLTMNKNLFKNWPLMSSIVLFCIAGFDDMTYMELFPLWAESDRSYGGLSLLSEDVGQVFAITGGSILLYQTFIFPHIVKILGPVTTSRVVAFSSMVLLFTYPSMTHLSGFWLSIVLNVASALKANFVVTIITCSLILQNNSVTQYQRATANGLATTLLSFSKALAPVGGGIVFSWVQKRQHAFFFPGDQMLFFLMDLIMFIALIWTFKPFLSLPEQLSSS